MTTRKHKKKIVTNNKHYKFKELINDERKKKIEQHPQSNEYFYFIKGSGSKLWRWYVSIAKS